MASHTRHVRSSANSERCQVRFSRPDSLYRGVVTSPWDGEVVSVPIVTDKHVVGPTILDMMVREVVRCRDLPEGRRPPNTPLNKYVANWKFRDPDTLWPAPGQPQQQLTKPREPDLETEPGERIPDHPFFLKLASGGLPVPGGPSGFQRVRKDSTVSIAQGAFRLAVAMHGGIGAAYTHVARIAETSWTNDLARAFDLWNAIGAAGGELIEDDDIRALRPTSSVSQEVERQIMREACTWLGIDPDADLIRPRGRPKAIPGDEGEILSLSIAADATVVGVFKQSYHQIKQGTALASLGLIALVEILGAFRTDGLDVDADLLEAYLDAAAVDWREKAAEAALGGDGTAAIESPYDILGVTSDTPMEEISAAFRTVMQALQHLPNASPQRRLIAAYKSIKAMQKEGI